VVVSNKRVLVVDDEEIVCESYKRVLSEEGYSVCVAQNGREAIAACRAEPFDVVLADLRMPDMDGLEVTRTVREEFPQARVLIVTGYPSEQSVEEAQRLGVFDYLHKPLAPERLTAVTAAALASPGQPAPSVARSTVCAEEEAVATSPCAAEASATQTETTSPVAPESVWKTLGVLAVAPVIGLAYVLLLPIIGFGMLFAVIGGSVTSKFGLMKKNPI
jgi:CheY-like chemotaxis protein